MKQDEIKIIGDYCTKIIDVLLSQEDVEKMAGQDHELFDNIGLNPGIDDVILSEANRIRIETFLYAGCTDYANIKFQDEKAFDMGNGTERLETYLHIMTIYLREKNINKLPQIITKVKDLIQARLEMIELTSTVDQSLLISNNRLKKDMEKYQIESQKMYIDINNKQKEVKRELANIERRKADIYKDIIAIISIFSGVILTFAGTFSFSSVILENLNSASFPKVITAIAIIFLFLLTLFIGLFLFSYGIVYEKPIYTTKDSITEEERNNIKRHKLSLLIPLLLAYVVAIALALTMIIKFPNELFEKTSDTKETQPVTTVCDETEVPTTE